MAKLENSRIYLRELRSGDLKAVHSYASLEKVTQFQPWGPNTLEDTRAYIEDVLKDAQELPQSRFVWAVVLKESEKVIGAGELWYDSFENSCGEIGYILHPDYWGIGIGSEVAQLLLEFGFKHRALHRIQATCAPDNMGSQKLLEKIGMQPEGRIRDALKMKGGWRDSLLYGMLESEWRDLQE